MENRKEIDNAIQAWSNKLEPDYLLSDFLRHPPVDFTANISEVDFRFFQLSLISQRQWITKIKSV